MKKQLIIHPFLIAVFPVLFLYANNISQLLPSVILLPFSLLLASSIFLYFIFLPLIRVSRQKGALIILLVFLAVFSYGSFYGSIGTIFTKFNIFEVFSKRTEFLLLTIYLFFFLVFMLILIRRKQNFTSITRIANLFSVILILFSLYQIANFDLTRLFYRDKQLKREDISADGLLTANNNNGKHPDIYYLIFDRYAGFNELQKSFNYDNSEFKNFLINKGFYVADKSYANYPKTFLSLASSLNIEYLDYLAENYGKNYKDQTPVNYDLIQNFKVWQFLKLFGYKYIHIGSGWLPTRTNQNADINIIYRSKAPDEFIRMLYKTTLAYPISNNFLNRNLPEGSGKRERLLFKLEKLKEAVKLPGPKFIFSHILLPHEPYVFGPSGEPVTRLDLTKRSEKENYLRQLQFTTLKIREVVEDILNNSQSPPIIIIQSDEGPFTDDEFEGEAGENVAWTSLSDRALKSHMEILNAYYLPQLKEKGLYPSITPVNTFRLIFNLYFDSKFPLLPDKNYIIRDLDHPYNFIDITEKLKNQE